MAGSRAAVLQRRAPGGTAPPTPDASRPRPGREARAIPRTHTQQRRAAFSALRERYGFSEYAFDDPVVAHGLGSWAHPIKYARLVRRSASSRRAQGADREGEHYDKRGRHSKRGKGAPRWKQSHRYQASRRCLAARASAGWQHTSESFNAACEGQVLPRSMGIPRAGVRLTDQSERSDTRAAFPLQEGKGG